MTPEALGALEAGLGCTSRSSWHAHRGEPVGQSAHRGLDHSQGSARSCTSRRSLEVEASPCAGRRPGRGGRSPGANSSDVRCIDRGAPSNFDVAARQDDAARRRACRRHWRGRAPPWWDFRRRPAALQVHITVGTSAIAESPSISVMSERPGPDVAVMTSRREGRADHGPDRGGARRPSDDGAARAGEVLVQEVKDLGGRRDRVSGAKKRHPACIAPAAEASLPIRAGARRGRTRAASRRSPPSASART